MIPYDYSLVISTIATTLVLLYTIPALIDTFRNITTSRKKAGKSLFGKKLYEDEDGTATPESQAAFSQKWPKIIITLLNVTAFGISVAVAVMTTLKIEETQNQKELAGQWLGVGTWLLILLQTTSILLSRNPVESFDLGLHGTISCIISFASQIIQSGLLFPDSGSPIFGNPGAPIPLSNAVAILRSTLFPLTILNTFAFATIPRRPTVFHDSKPVDGAFTVSALSRFTFSWTDPLVSLAQLKNKNNEQLEMDDLPGPDSLTRSRDLTERWSIKERKGSLWLEVFKDHQWAFISQWVLTLIQAFGNFAPAFVLLHILQLLEDRQAGSNVGYKLWIWVITLGATTVVASWIEAWLYWISWSYVAIPIRAQLSALIFQKSMRRKEIHGGGKKKDTDSKDEDKTEDEKEMEEPDQKSRQSTVNLIAVDAKRVSDFASFNNYLPGSLFKLLVSLAFLLTLLGWKALGAGFLTMIITLPINIYFSKKYSTAQGNLMTIRDVKTAVVTEALQGIRQIKFSALENAWGGKIGSIRDRELKEQKRAFQFDTMLIFCWIASPILLAATSLAVYAWDRGGLEASVAFSAISVFKQLEVTLGVVPELTTDLLDAWVSIKRIQVYMESPEIETKTHVGENVSTGSVEENRETIEFENASIAWPSDETKEMHETGGGEERFLLRNLNLSFPPKELSVISGKTGSGKSLLLSSILGEIDILSGSIHVPAAPQLSTRFDHKATSKNWILPTSLAYVAQIPWIENASIRDNILFGLPFDQARYEKTVDVCALRKDLAMLTDGESTEIGANGINLSGGQRWRVTFARALYSRAGILVLDDIFSAVDAHVGREIFEKGLMGELGVGRTRILVTHHVGLVKSKAKYLVELGDGTVVHSGKVEELEQDGVLEEIIRDEETEAQKQDDLADSGDVTAINSTDGSVGETGDDDGGAIKRVESKKAVAKFVEEETREKGRVKTKIYGEYLNATGGYPYWIFAIFVYAAQQVLQLARSWWLRLWTGGSETSASMQMMSQLFQPGHANQTQVFQSLAIPNQITFANYMHQPTNTADAKSDLIYYLSLYVALSFIATLLGTFRYYWIFMGSLRASKSLFSRLTHTILRTPLRWIDTVPLGRILNRFTTDVNVLDARLSYDVAQGANSVFQVIGVVVAGMIVSPYVIILAAIILLWSSYIARSYILGARAVKRLESVVKSPIFEQFSSALTGISTIRAFDKTQTYITKMYNKIDTHSTAYYHLWLFNRWMGFRLSMLGALFAMVVAAFIVSRENMGASLAGFALSFALDFTSAVIWTVRQGTNMELDFNAAERIIEYSNLTTESQAGISPPAAWPQEGVLEIENLVVGYAPDLPPVLKGLTFRVEKNERIGVVGRTGAGKSSLTLALFRFLEAREGSIRIDGIDISTIKLQDLRSRLAIIPQDPVLFSGTVRSNLDPFDQYSDEALREALRRVHLIGSTDSPEESDGEGQQAAAAAPTKNTNIFKDLNSPISPSGLNLSQGQRQLLCLARAIISSPKIIILDEATSAVDMSTDTLIQQTIRSEFSNSTLIVIAHRLSTIADFDKILVVDEGRVGEFGKGRALLLGEKGRGLFGGMVGESGEGSAVRKLVLGEEGEEVEQ